MRKLITAIAQMSLFRKVMVVITLMLLLTAVYFLIRDGVSWHHNKGAVLGSISMFLILVSHIGAHFYAQKQKN